MVPLTESVYAPASLADTGRVLVDVGTGYYAQMSADGAADFCRRKSAKLEETLKTVTAGLNDKRRALSQIEEVLEFKVMAARQQQLKQQQQAAVVAKQKKQPAAAAATVG